jgi:hypothetical protein
MSIKEISDIIKTEDCIRKIERAKIIKEVLNEINESMEFEGYVDQAVDCLWKINREKLIKIAKDKYNITL